MTTPIPVPPYIPLLTHAVQMDPETPIKTFNKWIETYGEIFEIYMFNVSNIWVSSAALCAEISNDHKFTKSIDGALIELRKAVGDGLFTARKDEPNWGIAHRLLTPSFRTTEVKDMFPDMLDIASQLVLKWERFGPEYRINPTEDFTDHNHPFVQAMYDFLSETGRRMRRPAIADYLFRGSYNKWEADMQYMTDLAQSILDKRRRHPIEKQDLVNVMLNNTDTKTGEKMSDESIINNLSSGHETRQSPEAMRKAQTEVDDLLGDQQLQVEDLHKLPYLTGNSLDACGSRTSLTSLKLYNIGNGKYFIKKDQSIVIQLSAVHRDKAVWGEDADEFKPERMLDGNSRHCRLSLFQLMINVIQGRAFAMQEATMALAMILQKFNFSLADPDYELEIMQTLSIKPKNFYIHATPRSEMPTTA
ncbi:cytochrome P450 [Irpex lacteus]|nr:cytochrome P450 [Irpex lacteus]